MLKRAAQEREDKPAPSARRRRRPPRRRRIQAEQRKAELAAAQKARRRRTPRPAAEAEQTGQGRGRRAQGRRGRQKAEEAERNKAAAEAAKLRAESEKQARQAEEERKKAELAPAEQAACEQQQGRLDELSAKGSDGAGLDDLKAFAKTVSCERLRPQVAAALEQVPAEAAKRAAALPNSPQLIRAAQTQLARLGCLPGQGRRRAERHAPRARLERYLSIKGKPAGDLSVTEGLVSDLDRAERPGLPAASARLARPPRARPASPTSRRRRHRVAPRARDRR